MIRSFNNPQSSTMRDEQFYISVSQDGVLGQPISSQYVIWEFPTRIFKLPDNS